MQWGFEAMADIKTHLRELSVATTIGLLSKNISYSQDDLYNSCKFFELASSIISNDISSANNLLKYDIFPAELKSIIDNGHKLGVAIYKHPHFNINYNSVIRWLGNDTQKGDPIDIVVGEYGFSLKEDSFILKNMGLYNFLNSMTGMSYERGLHVFSTFAFDDYEDWFKYTWASFTRYLVNNNGWTFVKNGKTYSAYILDLSINMCYGDFKSIVPINISSTKEYMKYTNSVTREKVFAKWINQVFSKDDKYKRLKKVCAEKAGYEIYNLINNNFDSVYIYDFLQIYDFEYYYAKTTATETTILRVPSIKDFNSNIEFVSCDYDVPDSQLNIISTFRNKNTGKEISFRNECRFSHGQFNGTPEAKMYVVRNSPLTELYNPI